jgi:anti-anti-sigma factor
MSSSVEGSSVSLRTWAPEPRGQRLEVQDIVSGGRHRLRLVGELDIASAPALEATIEGICTASVRAITLDLRDLTFIDSSGLRAIISASKQCEKRASEFRLIPGQPQVQRLFELTGLLDRLPFQPEAVA